LQVGILGYSDIARRKFIPALLSSSVAFLCAIASRNAETIRETTKSLKIPVISYDELLASNEIDLVYISLPNHMHEEWTIKALQAGKHVICEKPLALSSDSIKRMIACAEQNGLLLFENLMFLHHPQHSAVKNLINKGSIGKIVSLRSVFGFPMLASVNFRMNPAMGGGAFNDLSRYPISTALLFLEGELATFSGFSHHRNGLNLALHATATTDKSEIFSCLLAFGQDYESYYEITGETGQIRVDRAYTTPLDLSDTIRVSMGKDEFHYPVSPADHFLLALEHVCELIRNGGPFSKNHNLSLKIADIGDKIIAGCKNVEI
jgi:predicted dehydrogenase